MVMGKFCTSFDHTIYFNQVSQNISKGFRAIEQTRFA